MEIQTNRQRRDIRIQSYRCFFFRFNFLFRNFTSIQPCHSLLATSNKNKFLRSVVWIDCKLKQNKFRIRISPSKYLFMFVLFVHWKISNTSGPTTYTNPNRVNLFQTSNPRCVLFRVLARAHSHMNTFRFACLRAVLIFVGSIQAFLWVRCLMVRTSPVRVAGKLVGNSADLSMQHQPWTVPQPAYNRCKPKNV
jgi:hypothetical protein